MVLRASDMGNEAAMQDMEHLCRAYWYPIYAFVRRQN